MQIQRVFIVISFKSHLIMFGLKQQIEYRADKHARLNFENSKITVFSSGWAAVMSVLGLRKRFQSIGNELIHV